MVTRLTIIVFGVCLLARMSSSSGSTVVLPPSKRQAVDKTIVQHGTTKSGLAKILTSLHVAGMLNDVDKNMSLATMRRRIQQSTEAHSKANTPYGTVVQTMDLGVEPLRAWEYINPFALLWHLCTISAPFRGLMSACCGVHNSVLRVVTYIDEVCPGNPLRPEKSRTIQCLYWVFVEWPQWLLQRTNAWFCFGFMRTTLAEEINGGVSALMGRVLEILFVGPVHSFTDGIVVALNAGHTVIRATFCGILADEKAHKETFNVKGASGKKPCLSCANVMSKHTGAHGDFVRDITCYNHDELRMHTNESVYAMVDRLRESFLVMSGPQFKALQERYGVNYNEASLLFKDRLRGIMRPVDNMIRDPMHMIASNGFASTEIARIMYELSDIGISTAIVTRFAMRFTLPQKFGRVQASWFSDTRNHEDNNSSFASEILTIVPILTCFLVDKVLPTGVLQANIRCFQILDRLISLIAMGPEGAMPYIDELKHLVGRHHTLFAQLYSQYVKPKFHHALHMYDNMLWVRKLLSCFVTERKHRSAKAAALYVYRHIEHTVTVDLVNKHCEAMAGELSLYMREFLVHPKEITIGGQRFETATRAVMPCGEVRRADLVFLRTGVVGEVIRFWKFDSNFIAQIAGYSSVGGSTKLWDSSVPQPFFVGSDDIIDTLIWTMQVDGHIRVIPPFVVEGSRVERLAV